MKLIVKKKDGSAVFETALEQGSPQKTIGQDASCEIRLDSPLVSAKHAEVSASKAGCLVRDLESVNGVVIQGRRMATRKTILKPGSEFSIGDYLFRVELDPGESVAAAPSRRRILWAAAAVVLLAAVAAAFVAKRSRSQLQAPPPAAAQTPGPRDQAQTPQPAPVPAAAGDAAPPSAQDAPPVADDNALKMADLAKSRDLLEQGSKLLYEKNDYLQAGALFNQALKLDPNNATARNYLRLATQKSLEDAIAEGMRLLKAGNIAGARQALDKIRSIAPDDDGVKKFDALVAGQDAYNKAGPLFAAGKYQEIVDLLEKAVVPDSEAAAALLSEARRQLKIQSLFKAFDSSFDALDTAKAGSALVDVGKAGQLSQSQRESLDSRRLMLADYTSFLGSVSNKNFSAAIKTGKIAGLSPQMTPYPGVKKTVSSELDKIRAELSPQKDRIRQQADQALAAVNEADNPYEAAKRRVKALDAFVLADFLFPDAAQPGRSEDLKKGVMDFTRHSFQQAYLLETKNQYSDAAALYRQVLDVALPNDPFRAQAQIRQNSISSMLPQKDQLAIELEKRIESGEAILPAGSEQTAAPPQQQPASTPAQSAPAPTQSAPAQPSSAPAPSQDDMPDPGSSGFPEGMTEISAGKTLEPPTPQQGK